jgi:HSP20 family protein
MAHPLALWSLAPFGGRSPFADLVDALWQGAADPTPGAGRPAGFTPRIDVVESEGAIRVSAELPGLEEKDFEVTLEGDLLSIHGERRDELAGERAHYRRVERRSGAFRRTLRLPFEPAPETLSARHHGGVLTIEVPKPAERVRARSIPVTTA